MGHARLCQTRLPGFFTAPGPLLEVDEAPLPPLGDGHGHLCSPPAAGGQQAGAGSIARELEVAIPVC